MNEIIPGILEKDWASIEQKLEKIRPFARTVHIDLLDGKFAPNTCFADPAPFKKFSEYFYFELHMMVDDPLQYVQKWADAGFKRFIGHIEKMPDPKPAYNTVSTVVRVLEGKGFIDHKTYGNSYVYFPSVKETEYKKFTFDKMMKNYFSNSYQSLV